MTLAVENLNLGGSRRLPMLLQIEASECGLASLAMIAHYFGSYVGLAHLLEILGRRAVTRHSQEG